MKMIPDVQYYELNTRMVPPFEEMDRIVIKSSILNKKWRKLRDSNSRGPCDPYQFSRLVPSAAWVSFQPYLF
jgi:hypothetical protein